MALLRKIQKHAVEALVLEHVRHGCCDLYCRGRRAAGGWLGSKACKACCAAMQATISKLQRKHATT